MSIEKQASVINKAELVRRMKRYAVDTKYHFKLTGIDIKASTIAEAEGVVENWLRRKIDNAPAKGKRV